MKEIDFGVIAVTHACNSNCEFCVDKFVHKEGKVVSLSDVDKFLRVLKSHVGDKRIGIILLGGEPTMARTKVLVDICNKIHEYGFDAEMSTNGILRGKIAKLIPYFEWVKITAHNDEEIEYWSDFKEKVNLKWAGDESFTLDVYKHFVEMSEGFSRRSIPIYFNLRQVKSY